MPTLFDMCHELHEMVLSGEIDSCDELPVGSLDDDFDPARFIVDMFNNLPEDEKSIMECTTERQRAAIYQLFEGFCNGDWQSPESYL